MSAQASGCPPEPVAVEPPIRLSVRDKEGNAIASVIELGPMVLLRIGDRDLALTPGAAIVLGVALGVVAEAARPTPALIPLLCGRCGHEYLEHRGKCGDSCNARVTVPGFGTGTCSCWQFTSTPKPAPDANLEAAHEEQESAE